MNINKAAPGRPPASTPHMKGETMNLIDMALKWLNRTEILAVDSSKVSKWNRLHKIHEAESLYNGEKKTRTSTKDKFAG